jgi:YVTN family beta-propeller protein
MRHLTLFLFFITIPFALSAQLKTDSSEGDAINYFHRHTAQPDILNTQRSEGIVIPAGDAIEGDYIGQMTFTNDGKYVLVPHRQTNNISVFDFATQEIIANIPVGGAPTEVAVTDQLAVVPCLNSNEVYLLNLSDFTINTVINAPAQPAKVRISQDGSLAAIACDEADQAIIIDLNTFSVTNTISDFSCFISKFSLITSGPRNTVYWSDFEFTPDNTHLVVGSDTGLRFYDIATGDLSTALAAVQNTFFTGVSGDGQKMVAVNTGNPGTAHLIDLNSQVLEKTITYDGFFASAYSDVAVNEDGRRAFVPSSSGIGALIRFDEEDVFEVNTTSSANWVGRSADFQYAISGQFYLTLIDFETGAIVDQSQGRPIQNGVISPTNNWLVASDPLRYEALDFYTFDALSGFDYLGRQATGSALEADIPYSGSFTPDGSQLVVCNSLSGTVSVIDTEQEMLEAIIPLSSTETFHAAITEDGLYALVPKRLENQVDIISLQTMEVVQTIASGGSKPDQIFTLPGGEYAYVVNAGGTDIIGVIELDGANSTLVETFPCGNTGISWTNYGIRSGFATTPDGQYGLLATPFDEEVQVIDLNLHEIVASVPLGGFPLQVAVSDETDLGFFAAVTQKNEDAIAIIAPVGPDAAVLNTYATGSNPTRISYDETQKQFAVCLNDDNAIHYFDIETLAFETLVNYDDYTPLAVDFRGGDSYTVLRADDDQDVDLFNLFDDQESFGLPSAPIHYFALTDDGKKAAVFLPISDDVFLVNVEATNTKEALISLNTPNYYQTSPNPFVDQITFEWMSDISNSQEVSCRIYDSTGRIIFFQEKLPGDQFQINLPLLPSGQYWYQVISEKKVISAGQLIKK